MSYERICHELRSEFFEIAAKEGVEPKPTRKNHDAAKGLAMGLSAGGTDFPEGSDEESYAEGFARGFTGTLGQHFDDGRHYPGLKHLELGYANGYNARRILEGKLSATLPDGSPR